MKDVEISSVDVKKVAEAHYMEAPAKLSECSCASEHNLHVALSEQRGSPKIFAPTHIGLKNSYCETFGRCK